jgi:hypothetical protein
MDERTNPAVPDQDEGITAYHGSPHEFEQFDLSKIGTGEGAQAYGHGLYFAEAEPTAKDYRDRLSGSVQYKVHGRDASDLYDEALNKNRYVDAEILENIQLHRSPDELKEQFSPENGYGPEYQQALNRILPGLKEISPGHMYEVRINAHPDHFLDWDKPIGEQSEHVRNAFIKAQGGGDPELEGLIDLSPEGLMIQGIMPHAKGAAAYKTLEDDHGSAEAATRKLYESGIRGIRYLDGASRGGTDKPTSNYVVFDDKLVNVRRRYEQGGAVEDSSQDEWHPDTWYHGTPDARDIYKSGFMTPSERFNGSDPRSIYFFAQSPQVAKTYADPQRAFDYQGAEPEVIPVRLRMSNPKTINWGGKPFRGREKDESGYDIHDHIDAAREAGHDGVIIRNVIDTYNAKGKPSTIAAVFDASRIRHAKAARDPSKKHSRDIMAARGGSAIAKLRQMSDPAVNEAIRAINRSGSSPRDAVNLSKRLLGRQ